MKRRPDSISPHRPPSPPSGSRPVRTVRVALWSARHRWSVMLVWLVFTIGLFVASLGLGGIKTVSVTADGSASGTESGRAEQLMNPGDAGPAVEELDVVITSSSLRATDPAFQATVQTIVGRLRAITATVNGQGEPALSGISDPYAAPPSAGFLAPDLTSVRIVGQIEGNPGERETRTQAIAPVLAAIAADHPGYQIHAVGDTLLADQITAEINRDMDGSLAISLPATFLILFLAFGALAAAGVPLIFAITALLGAFGIFAIFSRIVEPVSPFAAQFIMLIGLAVAVDYSLFMITRFRSERRAGKDKIAAIELASATSGRAVLFSGIAVMISLSALFLLPDSIFQSIAVGTIAVIFMSVIGSLTFLPAVLSILGDGVNRGRLPFLRRPDSGSATTEDQGPWARLVRGVMSHSIVATVAATAVLLALAAPTARLHLGQTDISVFPESVDGVQAVQALQTHWPQGTLLQLEVVVTSAQEPTTKAAIDRLESTLLGIPGLSGPARVSTSADGAVSSVSVLMSGTQNDAANWEIVRQVRTQIAPRVFGGLPDVAAHVGGGAALSMDQTQIYTDGMARVLLFVLGFSFLLLLLVFHSIAIPIKATLLNLLATGAAFGALVLVFEDGWFGSLLGVTPTSVVQNWVPIFIFTVLFGLSMDYEVFIMSRIKEAFDSGADSHEAVARGIAQTAGTVTSAAAIMVVVFAIFLTLPLTIAREMGLGLAVAVFVDATVIRCVLLPATMSLLGDWNWWMPPFLRWLPRIRIEGESLAAAPATGTMLPSGTWVRPK